MFKGMMMMNLFQAILIWIKVRKWKKLGYYWAIIGSIFLILGVWMRLNTGIYGLIFGQLFIGMSRGIGIGLGICLLKYWFPPQERL